MLLGILGVLLAGSNVLDGWGVGSESAEEQFHLVTKYLDRDEVPQDAQEVLRLLRASAQDGHAEAQTLLAAMNLSGVRSPDHAHARAFHWLHQAAQQGDLDGQLGLGLLYLEGIGTGRDYAEAKRWLELGAEAGDPAAQYWLGFMYASGMGMEQDHGKAADLFESSAGQKSAFEMHAQYGIGEAYLTGLGRLQDTAKALEWLKQSVNRGEEYATPKYCYTPSCSRYEQGIGVLQTQSAHAIGSIYESGPGVPRDLALALKWYEQAAKEGGADSRMALGRLYFQGEGGVERDLKKAMAWLYWPLEQDHPGAQELSSAVIEEVLRSPEKEAVEAQVFLANAYQKGLAGRERNSEEAMRWYRLAADQGYSPAEVELGRRYAAGDGVDRDYAEAQRWYETAAGRGNANAGLELGRVYYKGKGVDVDYQQAMKWFRVSAEQGSPVSQLLLGMMHYNGKGTPKDDKEAVRWLELSAKQDLAAAQGMMGKIYAKGEGVEKNARTARDWLQKAAAQGDPAYQYSLGYLYETTTGLVVEDFRTEWAEYWYRQAADQDHAKAKEKLYNLLQEKSTSL